MNTPYAFEDFKVNLKIKLASLWTGFMFLYIYIDYYHLYMPGSLQDMWSGKVFEFQISQLFLSVALISTSIPALMVFFSLVLPAKTNRILNLLLAALYIPYSLFNLVGIAWVHMMIGAAIEVFLLGMILWYAWHWPRISDTVR